MPTSRFLFGGVLQTRPGHRGMPTSRFLFGGVLQTTPGHRGMPTSRCLLAANVARSNERAAIDLNHEIFVLNFKKSFSLIKESLIRAQALFFVHHTSWPFKTYFENGVQYGGSDLRVIKI